MDVTITLRLPDVPRFKRRWAPLPVLLLILAMPLAVLASDRFTDVATANPAHGDINAIATAGITAGCNPPTNSLYCPADAVTRQQMASFLHRALGRVAYDALEPWASGPDDIKTWTHTLTTGMPSSALAGAAGFIKVDAVLVWTNGRSDATDCVFNSWLSIDGVQISSTISITVSPGDTEVISLTAVGKVTTSGPRTIGVTAVDVFPCELGPSVYGDVTSAYFPFGSTGNNNP